MLSLFNRKLRLIVAGNDGQGIDLGRLSCKFEVIRDYDAANASAKVTVYNLSTETTAAIQSKYTRIRMDAGYDQRSGMIFDGDVSYCTATRDGADRIVEIYAVSGLKSIDRSFVNATLQPGSDVRSAVSAIADSMGIPISEMNLAALPIVGKRVLAGQSVFEMDKLAKDYSFRWMVDNSAIRVQQVPVQAGGPAIVVSRETGMIDTPLLDPIGVEFTTLLDPRLSPGQRVEVRSEAPRLIAPDETFQFGDPVFPRLDRTRFSVWRLLHIGATRGQPWYSTAYAYAEVS